MTICDALFYLTNKPIRCIIYKEVRDYGKDVGKKKDVRVVPRGLDWHDAFRLRSCFSSWPSELMARSRCGHAPSAISVLVVHGGYRRLSLLRRSHWQQDHRTDR